MFFLIKKIIGLFLDPTIWIIVALMALSVLLVFKLRKTALIFSVLFTVGAYFLTQGAWIYSLLARHESAFVPLDELSIASLAGQENLHIIVLGSAHREASQMANGTLAPSDALTGTAYRRLMEGVRLHQKLPQSTLVLSGGKGLSEQKSQAQAMHDVLAHLPIYARIDTQRIKIMDQGRTTEEEIQAMHALMAPNTPSNTASNTALGSPSKLPADLPLGLRLGQGLNTAQATDAANVSWVVVTSAMHMPRVAKYLKHYGLDATLAPTDFTPASHGLGRALLPDNRNLKLWRMLLHEWLGLLEASLFTPHNAQHTITDPNNL